MFLFVVFAVGYGARKARGQGKPRRGTKSEFDLAAKRIIAGFDQLAKQYPKSVAVAFYGKFAALGKNYQRSKFIQFVARRGGFPHFFIRLLGFRLRKNTPGSKYARQIFNAITKLNSEVSAHKEYFLDRDQQRLFAQITSAAKTDSEALIKFWNAGEKSKKSSILAKFFDSKDVLPCFFFRVQISENGKYFYRCIACIYDDGSLAYLSPDGALRHFKADESGKEAFRSETASPVWLYKFKGMEQRIKFDEYDVVKNILFPE